LRQREQSSRNSASTIKQKAPDQAGRLTGAAVSAQHIHERLRAGAEDAGVPLKMADGLFARALTARCSKT
jgi:hypothetical protein